MSRNYGKSAEECAAKVHSIPIIHVYGQLGKFAYPGDGSLEYGLANSKYENVARAAAGITLFHESPSDLRDAVAKLGMAKRICFLGFGYHPMNLSRLQLHSGELRRWVFGTAHGMIGAEVGKTEQELKRILLPSAVTLESEDNLTFLRKHLILG